MDATTRKSRVFIGSSTTGESIARAVVLPGLSATDPLNFAVVLAVMIFTGLAASWGPVRRAMAVDPNVALRAE
jgi:ABC-type lipoprotein release transport system permease subunit